MNNNWQVLIKHFSDFALAGRNKLILTSPSPLGGGVVVALSGELGVISLREDIYGTGNYF
jgi:hypothetical protein